MCLPGEGPSRESREKGHYDVLFCADTEDGVIRASVAGDMGSWLWIYL